MLADGKAGGTLKEARDEYERPTGTESSPIICAFGQLYWLFGRYEALTIGRAFRFGQYG